MTNPLTWLLSSSGFMPHGHCYLWQPGTLWLNVGSDGLIAGAYFAIPFALYYLVRGRRSEIPYPGILLMFAAFIFLCGTTHILEIITVWNPVYRLQGSVKLLTGLVSFSTMFALFRVIPQAMLLRSPAQLQAEVELQTAELAHVNAQLRAEIAARDLAQSQLHEQNRRKDEFLATLAHELRNPLAPIRHAAKLLTDEAASPGQREWSAAIIARQARRMALLLDDLLDVSRITRGRLELKRSRVELTSLVNTAIDVVRPAIEEKKQTLSIDLPEEALVLDADPLRLSQAISNLLTNASKFTPPQGRLTLSVARTPVEVVITVADTGVGFTQDQSQQLFAMFSQAHDHMEGSDGGLGIGLALVKGLVELHGGTVEARSAGPDSGAQFILRLPASMIASSGPASISRAAIRSSVSPKTRVLVVDDNRDAADTMGALLELSGHDVFIAHSGKEALSLGEQRRPDVVLLDIGLPDLNGYEVARQIRQATWGNSIFLVAVTGWGQPEDKERARVAGFDRHLTKPVDPDAVDDLLREHARTREK